MINTNLLLLTLIILSAVVDSRESHVEGLRNTRATSEKVAPLSRDGMRWPLGSKNKGPASGRRRVCVLLAGLVARDSGKHEYMNVEKAPTFSIHGFILFWSYVGKVLRCTTRGKDRQLAAARSQNRFFFQPLVELGFEVKLFLSISPCPAEGAVRGSSYGNGRHLTGTTQGNKRSGGSNGSGGIVDRNFTEELAAVYSPWVAGIVIDGCSEAINQRCLVKVRIQISVYFANMTTFEKG